ncbi:hypothetical protein ASG63_23110 [Methylobacterium sp. Leaf94]|uniref:glycosyltransferase family 2 protein n=1 Tax=Methylobacterium sp. Leaf94 TaxID=1736250 RepID=UPI0006FD4B71|nr:glycosyltransferase [Methylobacterium sp. Leaf94]KQU20863.1 hypothetical protein ASG63_23110 [Methylobacterium sp. Leaf94]
MGHTGSGPVRISVIIPHYQDLSNLDRCLTQLEAQTIGRDTFEIVVADNMSPVGLDALEAVVGQRGRVVLSREKGAGATRNVGVAASNGEVLAFIDSDCRPDAAFLEKGIATLSTFDIAGGAIRVDVEDVNNPTPSEAFELVFAFHNESYIKKKRFSVTAALFVSRRIFDEVGPFRNDVSEDVEWCHRAGSKGLTLGFAREAVVGHPARRDWSELERKWRRLNAEAFALTKVKPFGRLRWIGRSWVVLLSTGVHLIEILRTRQLSRFADRLAAMGILVRLRLLRLFWAHAIFLAPRPSKHP